MAKKRHCGNCGGTGHYTPTCNRKNKNKSKKSVIRRYSSTGSITRSRTGRSHFGVGSGWFLMYHGGRTGSTQHDKTWAVKIVKKGSGWAVVTRHGRRAGEKNETHRRPTSRDAASRTANSLIRQKLNKGYHPVGANR